MKKNGFSIEDKLSALFNFLSITIPEFKIREFCSKNLYIQESHFDAKGLLHVFDNILSKICAEHEAIKNTAIRNIEQIWNFELFYRNPLVKIKNEIFVLSETFITYHMWEGLYWDVRFSFPKKGEQFMMGFGKPFEKYIQEITQKAVNNSDDSVSFCNKFLYSYNGNQIASSDCYFKIANTLFVVEAKAKSPHSSTFTTINYDAIIREVDDLMVSPIVQVLSRLTEIFSDNMNKEI